MSQILQKRFCLFLRTYYRRTVGDSVHLSDNRFETRVHLDPYEVEVMLTDTAGQEEFLPFRSGWVSGKDGFVIASSVENTDLKDLEK